MKHQIFGHSGFDLTSKKSCKRVFLDEMERVIPGLPLVTLVAQYTPGGQDWPAAVRTGSDAAD